MSHLLHIIEPPAAPAPIVVIQKSQEIGVIKKTKTLTVTRPEPMTIVTRLWMNGMLIENSDKHQIESSIDTTSLSIMNMSVADSGIYQIEIISGTIHDFSVDQYIIDLSAKGKKTAASVKSIFDLLS